MARTVVDLPTRPQAAAAARAALEELDSELPLSVMGKARLLVTELVGNSVKYAPGGSIRVRVDASEGAVRVEVSDQGRGFVPPTPRRELLRSHGWGLVLVRRIATRWGTESSGRLVWFELDRGAPDEPPN